MTTNNLTILHISDTHNRHRELTRLPDADIIVHSGDITMAGSAQEAVDFINWFCDLPYKHKVFIAGNHDECLFGANISGLDSNCHYLCHSGVCIEGVKLYGVPLFMRDTWNGGYTKHLADIPSDTDVLITHQPPRGIMDEDGDFHIGNSVLMGRVEDIRPRLHLFGHIHNAFGITSSHGTTFCNAALLGETYHLVAERVAALPVFEI